jgi:hypothetical protein
MTDRIVSFIYATTLAVSQGLVTFTQVRAEQLALSKLTPDEVHEALAQTNKKIPIGFNKVGDIS